MKKILRVKVIKEGEHVEAQFDPAFFHFSIQYVAVHYLRWVVDAKIRH